MAANYSEKPVREEEKNDFSLAFLGNKSRSPQKFPARKSSGGMGG